ncbi:Ig-like domain-containing protein [Myxococcus sp. 1LA]
MRVLSLDVVEPSTPYTVRAGIAPASIVLDRVDTQSGYNGYFNFGFGFAWRLLYHATFVGSVTDIYGQPVPNAPVDITLNTPNTIQKVTHVSGVTDANGQFSIYTSIPHAWGTEWRQVYVFKEYYDRASFIIQSGTTSLSRAVYHYAHQIDSPAD